MTKKITAVLIVLALIFVPSYFFFSSVRETNITITEKTVKVADGQSKYLVFTDDGVYEDTDNIFFWKFDSSDVYNNLSVGKSYKVKVVGWRVPIFSWYPNILGVEK